MPTKTASKTKSQNQIRMDDALKARISKYQKKLEDATSGLEVSFSSAARSLIEKGLEAVKL
jgi:hypothetical protein